MAREMAINLAWTPRYLLHDDTQMIYRDLLRRLRITPDLATES